MYGYIYKTADIRPIGPSGYSLKSKPGARYGLSWEPEAQYALELLSISVSPSSVLAGTGILNPSFTLAWRGTPSGVNMTSAGTGYKELNSPFTEFTWTGTFPIGQHSTSRVFHIAATGIAGNITSGNISIQFLPHIYYTDKPTGTVFTSSEINTWDTITASGNYGRIFSDPAASNCTFIAIVNNAGHPAVIHEQSNLRFGLTAATGSNVNVTNEAGYTTGYRIWKTDYGDTGAMYYQLNGVYDL